MLDFICQLSITLPTPLESVLFPWLRMALDVPVEATVDDITLSASSPKIDIEDLTGVVISYEIYEMSLQRVSSIHMKRQQV